MRLSRISFVVLSLIGLGLSSGQAAADGGDSSLPQVSRAEKRELVRTILCARDLVQASADPVPGKYLALELLLRSRLDLGSMAAQQENLKECRATLRDLKSGALQLRDPGFRKARERFADWISVGSEADVPGVSAGINRLVKGFAKGMNPDQSVACELVGPEAAAGLGIVVSADASAGLCKGWDFRRYLAVGAGLQFGTGAVFEVSAHWSSVDLEGRADIEGRSSVGEYSGTGQGFGGNGDGVASDVSVGFGLGQFEVAGVRGTVRLIPVGSNHDAMLFQLLSTELR